MSSSHTFRSLAVAAAFGGALLFGLVPTLDARAYAGATSNSVSWERDKKSPQWIHGQVDVATAPAAVWDRVQRVPEWPTLFSDVKWLKVEERAENRWRVRLETRTMDCGAHDYTITFDPKQRLASLRIDASGIDSTARLIVRPGTGAAKANVAYSLYVRATGIVSWFVSEKALHKKQEQMVERNLRDLERAFGAVQKPKSPATTVVRYGW